MYARRRYSFFELPDAVIRAEAPYIDASSFNGYVWWPGQNISAVVTHINALNNKPVIISEYGFRAFNNTSGDPNWIGASVAMCTMKMYAGCLIVGVVVSDEGHGVVAVGDNVDDGDNALADAAEGTDDHDATDDDMNVLMIH